MTATVVPFRPSPEPAFVPEHVPVPEPKACAVDTTEDFETLRDRARALVAKGSYQEAGAAYLQAVEVATAAGETDLADEALCGWGAAETELGNGAEVMPELRRILLGSPVDHNCCLAAYTLARAHELGGQIKKALFYARLFRDRAEYVERSGLRGLAQNLLGNLLVAEGRGDRRRGVLPSGASFVGGCLTNLEGFGRRQSRLLPRSPGGRNPCSPSSPLPGRAEAHVPKPAHVQARAS